MQKIHKRLSDYSYILVANSNPLRYEKKYTIDDFEVVCRVTIEELPDNKVTLCTQTVIKALNRTDPTDQEKTINGPTDNRSVKNKRGQITDKIINNFLGVIDRFELLSDYRMYKIVTWPIIKCTIEKGWKMCDCWMGHEEHCVYSWPIQSCEYDFVTFTNGKYVISTDIMEGYIRIWVDSTEYLDSLNTRQSKIQNGEEELEIEVVEDPLFKADSLSIEQFQTLILELLEKYKAL